MPSGAPRRARPRPPAAAYHGFGYLAGFCSCFLAALASSRLNWKMSRPATSPMIAPPVSGALHATVASDHTPPYRARMSTRRMSALATMPILGHLSSGIQRKTSALSIATLMFIACTVQSGLWCCQVHRQVCSQAGAFSKPLSQSM